MHDFTPIPSLIGGVLIGLSASLFLLTHGKVAGISGLYGGILRPGTSDRVTRIAFVVGLLLAGALARLLSPAAFAPPGSATLLLVLAAGGLVGFGTQLGNGCTSGHGVCGISRFAMRSVVATVTFMLAGVATVFISFHLLGGAR